MTDAIKIHRAFDEDGKRRRLGLTTIVDTKLWDPLIPSGGDWRCVARDGAITRDIVWGSVEVANVNPRGDLNDQVEGQIAMAFRAMPMMDKALRAISVLAEQPHNCVLISQIALAVINYVEQPAPPIFEPE